CARVDCSGIYCDVWDNSLDVW
nr:immunoglobulin heavy chain junction region [Macaca mulatta]MOX91582.1 immunoglobulin heavy chain junction region [Macaca mulatta]MOX91779.1 immunoglobulin heavy chain junction region [Macaca mulatta]MOX91920.1 immunoglobulin heavy chain junction region [Macaca mulatta]MOX92062.1 immunoglobulin heavy chain junction region [Macaca mulatta]